MRCFEAAGVRITQSGLQETEPTIQTNVHPIESSKKLPLVNVQAVPIKSNLNQIQQQTMVSDCRSICGSSRETRGRVISQLVDAGTVDRSTVSGRPRGFTLRWC